MIIAKNDEEKRSRIWRIVTTVSSVDRNHRNISSYEDVYNKSAGRRMDR